LFCAMCYFDAPSSRSANGLTKAPGTQIQGTLPQVWFKNGL
jgi:hypothetical protein